MLGLYILGGYLLGVMIFARLWHAIYPWKVLDSWRGHTTYKFWGERVQVDDLRTISVGLGLVWPVLLPAVLIWTLLFSPPWGGTRLERSEKRKLRQEQKELETRERVARVTQMERELGIRKDTW